MEKENITSNQRTPSPTPAKPKRQRKPRTPKSQSATIETQPATQSTPQIFSFNHIKDDIKKYDEVNTLTFNVDGVEYPLHITKYFSATKQNEFFKEFFDLFAESIDLNIKMQDLNIDIVFEALLIKHFTDMPFVDEEGKSHTPTGLQQILDIATGIRNSSFHVEIMNGFTVEEVQLLHKEISNRFSKYLIVITEHPEKIQEFAELNEQIKSGNLTGQALSDVIQKQSELFIDINK